MSSRLLTCLISLCILSGLSMPEGEAVSLEPPVTHQQTLDNGLEVVWEEDRRQPLVAIEVRIKGGLRGEGPFLGSGITHFIEHMLFKGTPSRPVGTIEQEVRSYGGAINAFAGYDYTGIHLFVNSQALPKALDLLADILQHATFDPTEFEKERAVILSELQMKEDEPDYRVFRLLWSRHFLVHPYRHPVIGYQPLLERLTVEDLRRFYDMQYIPNNVTLVCVGDVEGEAFPDLVNQRFGSWARGIPYEPAIPQEPPAISEKTVTETLPLQVAYATLGFSSTRLADPDLYPLDVLAKILGDGRSSRLYEELVRTLRIADAVGASNYTPLDSGAFLISLRTAPDKLPAAIDAALNILEQIKTDGVSAKELQKAKRQVLAEHFFGQQTIDARASELANSTVLTGDPNFSQHYVEGIEAVTAEQVKQAARRYCDRHRMTTAVVQPEQKPTDAATSAPAPGLPTIGKTTLPNGLTLITGEDRRLPIVSLVVAFRGGVRVETEQTQGLSNLVAQMLIKGTKRRSASEIAALIESWGGRLDPFSRGDSVGIRVDLLAQDLDKGLNLVAELLTESAFLEPELATQRDLILRQLDAEQDEIQQVGFRLLRRTFFINHPYRFHPLGIRETVSQLTREDCRAFAKRWIVPNNAVLAVFGDVEAARAVQSVQQAFGSWRTDGPAPWPDRLEMVLPEGVREASLTMPKEQALILLGFPGTRVSGHDRHALDVLTTMLSGMSGRLFQAVREQQGLAYMVGAYHAPGWDPGYLVVYAATRPEERRQVLISLEEQLQRALEHGFTQDELDHATRALIGEHRLELQHVGGFAQRVALDELLGLGFEAWKTYEETINKITLDELRDVGGRYLTLSRRAQVVISPNGS